MLVLDAARPTRTEAPARTAAAGDPRCEVVRDPDQPRQGEAAQRGLRARPPRLVVVTDADTHMHPTRPTPARGADGRGRCWPRSPGAPHVTNRTGFICAMQVLEAATIIGLIRRTQSITGRVGVVAGVLGHVPPRAGARGRGLRRADGDRGHRPDMEAADGRMAYRVEPRALVGDGGALTPSLWAQRKRWARGQGEVLHKHLRTIRHWPERRCGRSCSSRAVARVGHLPGAIRRSACCRAVLATTAACRAAERHGRVPRIVIPSAIIQDSRVALALRYRYDQDLRPRSDAPICPMVFWHLLSPIAALRSQEWPEGPPVPGPRKITYVWDTTREPVLDARALTLPAPQRVASRLRLLRGPRAGRARAARPR